ncbi:TGS domain protein [Ancylostoma duodenale]|uniref:threonine--tRNA ligase n=1 Tax=Ancylostoma duodenale TaxID=51022 RepID=A0A0C2G3I2_9BILA|nr:TGS domain protein [Ancylostoma duodenale]
MWDKLMAEYKAEIAAKEPSPIKITLPDGKQFDAEAWRTTPIQIAEKISRGLADTTVIAKVNGEVFWHSSAHVLGEAMERYCGGHLCYGPPIQEGFYYDMWHDNCTISPDDFPKLDQIVKCAVKDKQPFERLEMSKEDLLEMFKYNEFKVRIIKEKIHTPKTTVYRCGPLIDLCRGPHVRHTGKIKVITPNMFNSKLWETSGHWQHYSEDMFRFEVEKEQFGLKPMNCPGHCIMYSHQPHTYNELPLRYADFGVLHRNEMSGALTGLTRVRRFQQDDAHIFCRRDQIGDEIRGCLDFLTYCYETVLGFTFKLNLATRPEGFLGDISVCAPFFNGFQLEL